MVNRRDSISTAPHGRWQARAAAGPLPRIKVCWQPEDAVAWLRSRRASLPATLNHEPRPVPEDDSDDELAGPAAEECSKTNPCHPWRRKSSEMLQVSIGGEKDETPVSATIAGDKTPVAAISADVEPTGEQPLVGPAMRHFLELRQVRREFLESPSMLWGFRALSDAGEEDEPWDPLDGSTVSSSAVLPLRARKGCALLEPSCSWDWPLSRVEKKSRVLMIDRQDLLFQHQEMAQELARLRKRFGIGGA
eukprot:CAMPEP_0115121330 /NCGR_PEP_ID=MMETSP0227-20121206/46188_1 /TAXON_ID=89957 /ORGANISM="Polarella glacialis, Strain CCMP 1383" /LENGTH=248 /DNA_ID=CAMNT_0002523101 /DNA_START=54 /DNA_END=800 /DNA_ORIENTATION=+